MPGIGTLTHEEIVFLLAHFYPGANWTLRSATYEGLEWRPPEEKPSLAELQSHEAEARTLIAARRARDLKESLFQQTYTIQDQIVNIMTAMGQAGNFAEFKAHSLMVAMRNLWNSL